VGEREPPEDNQRAEQGQRPQHLRVGQRCLCGRRGSEMAHTQQCDRLEERSGPRTEGWGCSWWDYPIIRPLGLCPWGQFLCGWLAEQRQ